MRYGSVDEKDSLLEGQEVRSVSSGWRITRSGTLSLLGLMLVGVYFTNRVLPAEEDSTLETSDLAIVATNEYFSKSGSSMPAYPWIDNNLVEPGRETTLTILDRSEAIATWSWTARMEETNGIAVNVSSISLDDSSSVATLTFHKVGTYIAEATSSDGRTVRSRLYCRYVRRELRSLSETDKDLFFHAMEQIWFVKEEEGAALYGENWHPITYFTQKHTHLAGDKTCDHMHDGLGFLTQHMSLGIEFEQTLQSVHEVVALPYWDFTVDAHEVITDHGGNWSFIKDSTIFSGDWYGWPENDCGHVTSGRVTTNISVTTDAWNYTHNSYGLMRSPWNVNKDLKVTRCDKMCGANTWAYGGWPSCERHYELLMSKNTWYDFAWAMPYGPHGPVHVVTGGTYGCENDFDRIEEIVGPVYGKSLRTGSFQIVKDMYRDGIREYPTYCAMDAPYTACKAGCPDWREKVHNNNDSDIWSAIAVSASMISFLEEDLSTDMKVQLLEIMCEEMHILSGDQLESASPNDAIFWPIHPTLERLWTWKKINSHFLTETWPAATSDASLSVWGNDCYGHAADDVTAARVVIGDDRLALTNAELYALGDPLKPTALPYVFDDFRWKHCAEEGFDFEAFASITQGNVTYLGP